eukprot:190262_1
MATNQAHVTKYNNHLAHVTIPPLIPGSTTIKYLIPVFIVPYGIILLFGIHFMSEIIYNRYYNESTNNIISMDWTYWFLISAFYDAFATFLISPLQIMRTWHRTVSLCAFFPIICIPLNSKPQIREFIVVAIIISLCYIFWWYNQAMRSLQSNPSILQDIFSKLKRRLVLNGTVLPDTSSWYQAITQATVEGIFYLMLWYYIPAKWGLFVVYIGVIFDIVAARFRFGGRTVKSDLLGIFVAMIPYTESACSSFLGSYCSMDDNSEHEKMTAFIIGMILGECFGLFGLNIVHGNTLAEAKGIGSVIKVFTVVYAAAFGAPTAVNTCRIVNIATYCSLAWADILSLWIR